MSSGIRRKHHRAEAVRRQLSAIGSVVSGVIDLLGATRSSTLITATYRRHKRSLVSITVNWAAEDDFGQSLVITGCILRPCSRWLLCGEFETKTTINRRSGHQLIAGVLVFSGRCYAAQSCSAPRVVTPRHFVRTATYVDVYRLVRSKSNAAAVRGDVISGPET